MEMEDLLDIPEVEEGLSKYSKLMMLNFFHGSHNILHKQIMNMVRNEPIDLDQVAKDIEYFRSEKEKIMNGE